MTYIEIAGVRYPATIHGRQRDPDWDNRQSKAITLEMTYEDAVNTFVDGLAWNIVYRGDDQTEPEIYDNSEYDVAGPVTDNRDGTVTVKMGVLTDAEALAIILGEG
jgi:hypothetical protein